MSTIEFLRALSAMFVVVELSLLAKKERASRTGTQGVHNLSRSVMATHVCRIGTFADNSVEPNHHYIGV